MHRVFFVLIMAAIVVAIAWYLASLPGDVTATIGGITVEAMTPVVALALLALFVVLFVLLRLIGALFSLPRRLRRRRELRRTAQPRLIDPRPERAWRPCGASLRHRVTGAHGVTSHRGTRGRAGSGNLSGHALRDSAVAGSKAADPGSCQ